MSSWNPALYWRGLGGITMSPWSSAAMIAAAAEQKSAVMGGGLVVCMTAVTTWFGGVSEGKRTFKRGMEWMSRSRRARMMQQNDQHFFDASEGDGSVFFTSPQPRAYRNYQQPTMRYRAMPMQGSLDSSGDWFAAIGDMSVPMDGYYCGGTREPHIELLTNGEVAKAVIVPHSMRAHH